MRARSSSLRNVSIGFALILAAGLPAGLPAGAYSPVSLNVTVPADAPVHIRLPAHVAIEELRPPTGVPITGDPGAAGRPLASLYVDPAGSCGGNTPCFTTIQAAINAATPGDTVNVGAGTYRENVTVDRTLTLIGAGQEYTIVEPAISDPNCGGGGGGSLCPGASNIFLIQASGVTLHDFTLDGDNPTLTSGIIRGGADIDARNGVITNHLMGTYTNLQVYNTTVRNVYLRGMYASSGGTFNFHNDTVTNVQGDGGSIALFNFGGSGIIANNMVIAANDAISANHSRGTQFLNNTITTSGSGVHTDNAGDSGGSVADLIQGNSTSNCMTNGYGIFVFVPYIAPTVHNNSIAGCAVGVAAFGQGAAVTTTFDHNTVDGTGIANTTGAYVTTDQLGFGYQNVSVLLTCNTITRNAVGLYMEQPSGSAIANATLHQNNIATNTAFGVQNVTTTPIDATNNWWGAASGPTHPSNPGGTGDTVTDFVNFTPFLTNPSTCATPPPTIVVVHPSNLQGWASYDENTAGHAFGIGPYHPPYGLGSYQLQTGSGSGTNLGGKTYFATDAYSNTLLANVTALSYSTYIDPASQADPNLDIAINLQLDTTGDNLRDTDLIFEPIFTYGAPTKGVWQTWDARAGIWWNNRAVCGHGAVTHQSLSQWITDCPGAKMVEWYPRADGYATGLSAGQASGGAWANFIGYADGFSLNTSANSTIYDFEPDNPTRADVRETAAAPSAAGGVDLQWTAASETAHLGYNVLRALRLAGPYQPVNTALLRRPGPLSSAGPYRFHDPTGSAAAFYQIQAVALDNHTQTFAPFAVGSALPAPAAPRSAPAAAWAAANHLPPAAPHPLTAAPYRLTITRDGIARVTYEQLAAAGVPLAGLDPAGLALAQGPAGARVAVPLAVHLANPALFGPGDSFDFLAHASPAAAGDSTAYYLSAGPAPGARMTTIGSGQTEGPVAAAFPSTVHSEENHFYWQYAPDLGAPQPEGPWFWAYTLDAQDATATVNAPAATGAGPPSLTVHLQGWTSVAAAAFDHHLQLALNGTLLGERQWRGLAPQDIALAVPAGVLRAGANTLTLHTVPDPNVAHDGVVLAGADLSYSRAYRAADDSLRLVPVGSNNRRWVNVAVGGFSRPDGALYDVSAAAAPRAVPAVVTADGAGGYRLAAQVPRGAVTALWAAAGTGFVAPVSIQPVAAGDLHQGSADYVVIAADSLLAAGQQLAGQEQAAGLRPQVVAVSAIYDQFGSGVPAAAALRAFLAATAQWQPAPRYVALLGSASYDSHGYSGSGAPDLVPTGYVATQYMGRTASDSSLLPTLLGGPALGRLPARDPAEAAALVRKLGAYRGSAHEWATQASVVADGGSAGATFEGASERLAGLLGGLRQERLYVSRGVTSANLVTSLNAGRALVNYYGHGSYEFWSGSNLLSTELVNSLSNSGREAFITSMSCETGDFDWAQGTNLLNALVLKGQGGAIGAIGATGASTAEGQEELNAAIYGSLLKGARVGDALRAGYAAVGGRGDVVAQFGLIGDPALQLDLGH